MEGVKILKTIINLHMQSCNFVALSIFEGILDHAF